MNIKIFHANKSELYHPRKNRGTITWRCPSNVSLIKYWGKYEELLPYNPSISLTLTNAYTVTKIDYTITEYPTVEYFQDGILQDEKTQLIIEYLEKLYIYFTFLPVLKLVIHSSNSFPQYSGIVPSSSEMGSLALCLCSIEEELTGQPYKNDFFFKKASFIARLASGCASRSIYGGSVLWGSLKEIKGSSDLYGIPLNPEPLLEHLNVAILIISTSNNMVPIRHFKMQLYELAHCRCAHAVMHSSKLLNIIKSKDYFEFCKLVEGEALTLHTTILSSTVLSLLFYPETLNIISEVRAFREKHDVPVCFSIDAAPNIYLIYPNEYKETVVNFINEKLITYCEDKKWLDDKVGNGPELLDNK